MSEPVTEPGGRAWRFAGCELDVARRELRRQGALVTVQPKVFDLIAYLLEHCDRAVDKTEIQDAIWPNVVVTETSLTQAIRKARVALGDDANLQTIIRTVHGHGYRFVAELEEGAGELPSAPPATTRARIYSGRWIAAALTAIAVALAVWMFIPGGSDPAAARIAVLPVANDTGEEALDWIEVGLMALGSSLLDSAGHLAVVDDADVLRVARAPTGGAAATDNLRRMFGATHFLRVRVGQAAGLLRMSYEIADLNGRVREGTSVGEDVTVLMRGVVQDVVARLGGARRLPPEETLISDDPFVNEAFARGLALSLEGRCADARVLYAAALGQAPALFEPRLESAKCARILGEWQEAESLLDGLVAEQSAGAVSRSLARAILALGIVYNRTGRLDPAETNYARALEIARAVGDQELMADALVNQSILARSRSDFDGSIELLSRARDAYASAGREVMPGDVYSGLANASMEKGALDQADGYLEQAIASFHAEGDRRREALVINNRGLLRRLQGRLDEAEVLHLESARIREEIGDKVGVGRVHNMLAVVYNERGKFDQALASGAIALEVAVQAEDTLYVGTAHAQLGDARLGLGQFEAAQDEYREAGRVLAGFGDRRRVLEVDLKLAAVDLARGRPGPATDTVRKVADAARSEGFGPVEVQALRQQGDIALARRDRRAAVAFYEQALQQARDIGQSGDEIGLSVTLAGLHLDAGDPDAAAPLMGYLAGQPDSDLLRELRARYDRARAGSSAAQ